MRHKPELVDLRFDLYGKRPRHVAIGDSHDLWVTCSATSEVALLHDDGTVETFPTDAAPDQIARGTTTIWYTMPTIDSVGLIDAKGKFYTHKLPTGSTPTGLTTIGDDAWITVQNTGELAKVTPDGSTTVIHPTVEGDDEPANPADAGGPRFVAADDRGSLWFTRAGRADIVRLDPDNTTESWASTECVDPWAITVDREAIWITDSADGGGIWRIGRDEKVLQRVEPWPRNVSGSIASDGRAGCWFTEEAEDLLAHLDIDAKLTEWDLSDYGERPRGVAVDEDGVAWVVLRTGGVIGATVPRSDADADADEDKDKDKDKDKPDYTII